MATLQPKALKLDQFLKLSHVVSTGGQAKILIQSGDVWVNGAIETRRGRKLQPGDRVQVAGRALVVEERDLHQARKLELDSDGSEGDRLR